MDRAAPGYHVTCSWVRRATDPSAAESSVARLSPPASAALVVATLPPCTTCAAASRRTIARQRASPAHRRSRRRGCWFEGALLLDHLDRHDLVFGVGHHVHLEEAACTIGKTIPGVVRCVAPHGNDRRHLERCELAHERPTPVVRFMPTLDEKLRMASDSCCRTARYAGGAGGRLPSADRRAVHDHAGRGTGAACRWSPCSGTTRGRR